jgi:hypothetical protein
MHFASTSPAVLIRQVGGVFIAQLNEQEAALALDDLQVHFEAAVGIRLSR